MRSILILICVVVFIQDFTQGRLAVNDDGIVGVSQQKLKDYMVKAIKGFRKIMLVGDTELDYPVMDPYELVDASWDLSDKSISKKYSLNFFNKNTTIIKGLANYEATNVEASAKDMRVSFMLTHRNISSKIPYKLDGYLLKNFMPVFGDGFIEFSTPNQVFQVVIDQGMTSNWVMGNHDQGRIAGNLNSEYNKVRKMISWRKTDAFKYGSFKSYVLSTWVYSFTRRLNNEIYLVIFNLGKTDTEYIDLKHFIENLPDQMVIKLASRNSDYNTNNEINTNQKFKVKPQVAVVLYPKWI